MSTSMNAATVAATPDDVDGSSVPGFPDRSTEEPRGRWDNRCDFTRMYGSGIEMVCDRRIDHAGLHHGRLFNNIGWAGATVILGWVTVLR